jgi:hypothetical protein
MYEIEDMKKKGEKGRGQMTILQRRNETKKQTSTK